jgi:hypothetical protein
MVKIITILILLLHSSHSLLALPMAMVIEDGYELSSPLAFDILQLKTKDKNSVHAPLQNPAPSSERGQEEWEILEIESEFCHRTGYPIRPALPLFNYDIFSELPQHPLKSSYWDIQTPPPKS